MLRMAVSFKMIRYYLENACTHLREIGDDETNTKPRSQHIGEHIMVLHRDISISSRGVSNHSPAGMSLPTSLKASNCLGKQHS